MTKPINIGLIPDGNRRAARSANLPEAAGHATGLWVLHEIISDLHARPELVNKIYVYLFAWHNWERDHAELYNLFNLYVPIVKELRKLDRVVLQLGHPPREIGEPIDLIIRSGGQNRLSGFFPEESKNAKLVVLDEMWPKLHCMDILSEIQDFMQKST